MIDSSDRLDYLACGALLRRRLQETPPTRIQLLCGPRQVGKTTLLLELADELGPTALYAAGDGPEAALPGFWERLWTQAERLAGEHGRAVVLLDEAHLLPDWSRRLKGEWDRVRRRKVPLHVLATGSSALRLSSGTRESLAGRFERITLPHWSAASLAATFDLPPAEAADQLVRMGSYPGAFSLRDDRVRWSAYVRDAILDPALGRDILALAAVRKPALLRQIFAVCAALPAQIVSLQKIQGQLQDAGALETVAHYLKLLEEAFLVAALPKYSTRPALRSAPPKLVTLNNALLAAIDRQGSPTPASDPVRFGRWLENACLAFAWNSGQQVSYWREEPFEVDALVEGSWGRWAIEVKSGEVSSNDLRGLAEFTRRYASFRPLVVCDEASRSALERSGFECRPWSQFLLEGPPAS